MKTPIWCFFMCVWLYINNNNTTKIYKLNKEKLLIPTLIWLYYNNQKANIEELK